MAYVWTTQYQPISNAETVAASPLSVRHVRDFADALNNHKRYVTNFKVRTHIGQITMLGFEDVWTDERCMMHFAPVMVPQGYTHLRWTIGHALIGGYATGTVTWRLYCLRELYTASADMVTASIQYGYGVNSIVSVSTTYGIPNATLQDVPIVRDSTTDCCWLVVTAQASDGTTLAYFDTLDVWPVMA